MPKGYLKQAPVREYNCPKCGRLTKGRGDYCGECNTEYWADQDAKIDFQNKGERRVMETIGVDKARQLGPLRTSVTLTRPQATEILVAVWPQAPRAEVLKAAMICEIYHLNPLMKHVYLMPFNRGKQNESWAVAIGIKATRLMALRKGPVSFIDNTPRVMTADEQVRTFGEVEDAKIWAVVKLRDERTKAEVVGYGWWPKETAAYGADKGNTKFNMASIRAERQAWDRIRPGEMPSNVEVVDEDFQPDAARIIEVQGHAVDTKTGEIAEKPTEGSFREVDPDDVLAEHDAAIQADKDFEAMRSAAPVTVAASSVPNPTPEPEQKATEPRQTKQRLEMIGELRFYMKKLGKDEKTWLSNGGYNSVEEIPMEELATAIRAMLAEMSSASKR